MSDSTTTITKDTGLRTGSCLCGNIQFELTSVPLRKVLCHCANCKKATGSSFVATSWYTKAVSSIPSYLNPPELLLLTYHILILTRHSNSTSNKAKPPSKPTTTTTPSPERTCSALSAGRAARPFLPRTESMPTL